MNPLGMLLWNVSWSGLAIGVNVLVLTSPNPVHPQMSAALLGGAITSLVYSFVLYAKEIARD